MSGGLCVSVSWGNSVDPPLAVCLNIDLADQGSDPDDVRRNVQRKVEQLVDELFARLRDREGGSCGT